MIPYGLADALMGDAVDLGAYMKAVPKIHGIEDVSGRRNTMSEESKNIEQTEQKPTEELNAADLEQVAGGANNAQLLSLSTGKHISKAVLY